MKQTTRLHILRLFLCVILIGVASGSPAQSIRNEQYISLLNYLNPVYGITFGAPATLGTNYTFLLPDAAPTTVNQTLVVTSYAGGVFSLGWGGAIGYNSWCLAGNTGTSASSNFIGTIDGVDFVTRTNNTERMRVTSTGKLGIGTSSPTQLVEVKNGNLLLSNSSTASQLQFQGTSTGATTFAAGAQGATTINYTLPTAQGASKTYLQNNGSGALSWVDLSTQIGGIIFARKTSDETVTNSTTLQDDDDLSFAIGANETWEVIVQMEVTSQNDDAASGRSATGRTAHDTPGGHVRDGVRRPTCPGRNHVPSQPSRYGGLRRPCRYGGLDRHNTSQHILTDLGKGCPDAPLDARRRVVSRSRALDESLGLLRIGTCPDRISPSSRPETGPVFEFAKADDFTSSDQARNR